MQTRCPNCRTAVELTTESSLSDIDCATCGSVFSIVEDKTVEFSAGDEQTVVLGGQMRSKEIGHFQLEEQLGAGAFGSVWKAHDTELDRAVAIKFPHKEALSAQEAEKFLREARAAAQLRHPNIVSVHEIGRDEDTVYIVGDFILGLTLSDWMADLEIGSRETAEMCAKLADALHHAHEAGVIHRDFKPGNVMIDGDGEPHVMDFGLAKREVSDVTMTVEGRIMGTPAYMSPEQARGEGYKADRRTDIYALGVVLYQMLTGELPFRGNPRMVLHQLLSEDPRPPRSLNDQIPPDMETICLKCMEKEVAKRYATAQEVADDLRHFLRREPISARPIGRPERFWRWCRRNPAVAALSATAVSLVVVVAVVSSIGYVTSSLALAEAERARTGRALAQIDSLLTAEPESVPLIVDALQDDRDDIRQRLRELAGADELPEKQRLRVRLALLPGDAAQLPYLRDWLLEADAREFGLVRWSLEPHKAALVDELWQVVGDERAEPASRFRAALALASYDPPEVANRSRWQIPAEFITDQLMQAIVADPNLYEPWVEGLRPASGALLEPLADVFRDARPEAVASRRMATNVLATYAADRPDLLAELLVDSSEQQAQVLLPSLVAQREAVLPLLDSSLEENVAPDAEFQPLLDCAKRRANAALALLALDAPTNVWAHLAASEDPTTRSLVIHGMAPWGIAPAQIVDRLDVDRETSVPRALVLALGEYDEAALPIEERREIVEKLGLVEAYREDPDPGVHSALEWLLSRWGFDGELREVRDALAAAQTSPSGGWYMTGQGQTMAVLPGGEFMMGSPGDEPGRAVSEPQRPKQIDRRLAISTKEVTAAQFQAFVNEFPDMRQLARFRGKITKENEELPVTMTAWYHAAMYCRWLSEQEAIAEEQMCYPPLKEIGNGMKMPADYLRRTGYRLPTDAEWEYAARAGAGTSRYFGRDEDLLEQYALYVGNSQDVAQNGGHFKPNDFGLFDPLGNVWEWCQDRWTNHWSSPSQDTEDDRPVDVETTRILRGGSFVSDARMVRSAYYNRAEKPTVMSDEFGFRIARTMPE